MTLAGKVVRTWRTDEARGEHAGIQFDPVPAPTTGLINRYLVAQLRETLEPPGGLRPPAPDPALSRPTTGVRTAPGRLNSGPRGPIEDT